jgi:hypothetical protein
MVVPFGHLTTASITSHRKSIFPNGILLVLHNRAEVKIIRKRAVFLNLKEIEHFS